MGTEYTCGDNVSIDRDTMSYDPRTVIKDEYLLDYVFLETREARS